VIKTPLDKKLGTMPDYHPVPALPARSAGRTYARNYKTKKDAGTRWMVLHLGNAFWYCLCYAWHLWPRPTKQRLRPGMSLGVSEGLLHHRHLPADSTTPVRACGAKNPGNREEFTTVRGPIVQPYPAGKLGNPFGVSTALAKLSKFI